MSKNLLETSKFVAFLRMLYRRSGYLDAWLGKLYRDSQIHILIYTLSERIKVCFRYSFIGKITETKEDLNFVFLNNSKIIRRLGYLYAKGSNKIDNCLQTSIVADILRRCKKEFHLLQMKKVGIVISIAVMANLFFSILLKIEISLFGWLMRGLILFVGIAGIFCNADWLTISSNSKILRKILSR